jgi:exopolysaccharide production protein ExoZ
MINKNLGAATGHVTSVDAARGLFAFSVMAFHLLSNEGVADFENVGYYAVYAFFAISGFSLWISYFGKFRTGDDIRSYLIKRFFRIAPLYYVALVLRLLLYPLPSTWPLDLPANMSLLLGFYNAGATSLVTGGWSLGIEFVFYLLLPILFVTVRGMRTLVAVTAASFVMQFLFINMALRGAQVMTGPIWSGYAQPVSFVGYFMAGCLIGEIHRISEIKQRAYALPVAFAAIVIFAFIPSPYPIGFLTGWKGVALAALTITFVAAVAFAPPATGRILKASIWVGVMSYPVYLLHPLVHYFFSHTIVVPTSVLRIAVTIAGTVALSMAVSRKVEIPLRNLGRRLAAKA